MGLPEQMGDDKKIGIAAVRELLAQAEAVQAEDNPPVLRTWLFAHQGLTKEAGQLARKVGLLWSTRAQLDALLVYLGLRTLPDI